MNMEQLPQVNLSEFAYNTEEKTLRIVSKHLAKANAFIIIHDSKEEVNYTTFVIDLIDLVDHEYYHGEMVSFRPAVDNSEFIRAYVIYPEYARERK